MKTWQPKNICSTVPEMRIIFQLWRNEPAVIIGQNQNAYAEIDRTYAELHGIKIVRRLTGGGAVFHDLGNINYTFISKDVQGGSLNLSVSASLSQKRLNRSGLMLRCQDATI